MNGFTELLCEALAQLHRDAGSSPCPVLETVQQK